MGTEPAALNDPVRRLSTKGELLAVATILVVLLAVNLLTSTTYPVAWLDEVMFTDPAVNLALGAGFHTTAWLNHGRDSFFFGYAPLYPTLLSGWIRLVGFGMVQVRSLNYLLVAALSVSLWTWSQRTGLVPRAATRIVLVLLVCLGYGVAFSYRSGRPDVLMALMTAFCCFAMTMPQRPLKDILVVVSCAALPFAGIQLVPFGLMTLVLVLLFYRGRALRTCMLGATGLLLGAGLLMLLYQQNHVFHEFRTAMAGQTDVSLLSALRGKSTFKHQNALPKDFSLFVLSIAACIVWWTSRRATDLHRQRRVLALALVATLVVPLGMVTTGKFPTYYSWMVYLPLALGTIAVHSQARSSPRFAKIAVNGLLVLTCAMGLPFQLAYASHDSADRDHQRVLDTLEHIVPQNAWTLIDYGAFYAVRPHATKVFLPHSFESLSREECAKITLMVIDPATAAKLQERIGGHWRAIGPPILPSHHMLFEDLIGVRVSFGAFDRKYQLQAYTRGS